MEVVLLAPFLMVLVFLTFEFGNVFLRWLSITNAAREGARLGMTQAWSGHSCGGVGGTGGCTQIDHSIRRRVCQAAPSGPCTDGIDSQWQWCGADSQPPTGYSSCVSISWSTLTTSPTTSARMVTVAAVSRVQTLFPLSGTIPYVGSINYPGSMTVTSLTSMRSLE